VASLPAEATTTTPRATASATAAASLGSGHGEPALMLMTRAPRSTAWRIPATSALIVGYSSPSLIGSTMVFQPRPARPKPFPVAAAMTPAVAVP
jgi:predicted benzoate:H+ symporter BenE